MESCDLVDYSMVEKSKLVEESPREAVDPTPTIVEWLAPLMYLTDQQEQTYHLLYCIVCSGIRQSIRKSTYML
ncbi:hypothetical protein Tco_0811578 [Tanacetum coccineum]